jgi:hypothetical protein
MQSVFHVENFPFGARSEVDASVGKRLAVTFLAQDKLDSSLKP